jgi:hypothetical protein
LKTELVDFQLLIGDKVDFHKALESLLHLHFGKYKNKEYLVDNLLKVIQDPKFLNGHMTDSLFDLAHHLAKDLMCPLTDPVTMAKTVDMNGYILSYSAIDKLRAARISGSQNEDEAKNWVASKRQVTKVIEKVEEKALKMCPITVSFEDGVEQVMLDYNASLIAFLKAYSLYELAKQNLSNSSIHWTVRK